MYTGKFLLYIRSLTPLHVGIGRGYTHYVDLPVQRDEFGYPTIWSSSLKGAIKANLSEKTRMCLGPEPTELEVSNIKQSRAVFTDAKLLFMPVRVMSGVYAYMSSPTLLNYIRKYIEAYTGENPEAEEFKYIVNNNMEAEKIKVSSEEFLTRDGYVVINEVWLPAEVEKDLLSKLRLDSFLPKEIRNLVEKRLILVPDKNNISLSLVNKSIMIQHRVRLSRNFKIVEEGPWSEEYVPSETIFVSLVLCKENEGNCSVNTLSQELNEKIMFIGGRETIGKGLVKTYTWVKSL